MSLERIHRMVVKEFIHVFRDPRMRVVVLLVPVVQVLIFGYAATTDVRHVATAVCDLDHSVASRDLVARFVASGYFDVVHRPTDDREIRALLDRGDVQAVLRMNRGFGDDLNAGRTAVVQLLLDGTDSNTAGIVLDYAGRIVGEASNRILIERQARLRGAAARPPGVDLEERAWFNDNLESRSFYVPGVIAMLVMLVSLLLTSMAVVREREVGTLEQIAVTPITRSEFILGKTVPFALIGFFDVVAITAVGVFWFGVPVRGSLPLLFGCTTLYLMTSLGAGLLISTISATQQQAMMTVFLFYFPAVLLSGFVFPIANMPQAVQAVTYLNPLRYFLIIIRGLFLKGAGVRVLWPEIAALAAMGVFTLVAATRKVHKTLA